MAQQQMDVGSMNLTERIIRINRVSKVVKGGRRFGFSALVAVGDGEGSVGIGIGRANEVPESIRKAVERAKRDLYLVPLVNGTFPHEVLARYGAGRIVLKPASPGTGVIAGGAVRAILESAGVRDALTKSLGTANPVNVARATMAGLRSLRTLEQVAKIRGLTPEMLAG